MRTNWNRVDLTRVAELRTLVDAARTTPCGRDVMDRLAARPTNLRIHTDAQWDADPATRGQHGVYAGADNTMHLPERVLTTTSPGRPDDASGRDDLLTFVHESVHRTQLPPRFPRVAHAADAVLASPWRMAGAGIAGAVDAARAGSSSLRGARDGVVRSALQVEVEAFDIEQRMAAELAAAAGHAEPRRRTPDEIAAWIREDYAGQTRGRILAGTVALGMQAGITALGAHELHARFA